MTLAFVILIGLFGTPPIRDAAPSPPHAASIVNAQQEKEAADTPSQQGPASTSAAQGASGSKTHATTPPKRVKHRKKKVPGCDPVSAPMGSGSAGSANAARATNSPQNQDTAKPVSHCPPQKIVVRHGGATDPSIQLGGGTPRQDSQEQATANQMLQSTEDNLKKLEARQLTAAEQATVTQIRQYVEQSKSALAASDPERARTLAWKAQTLSDDLVTPR